MVNRDNYRAVKAHLRALSDYLSPASVGRYWHYLRPYLLWADERPFNRASAIQPGFVSFARSSGLSAATLRKVLHAGRRMFRWLGANEPAAYRGLPGTWIDTLRAPRETVVEGEHVFVSFDEALRFAAIAREAKAAGDLTIWRDGTAAVFLFLSGMRNGAFASMPINCVDVTERTVRQDPALGVRTKNSKSAVTHLLPVAELLPVVAEWDAHVRARLPATTPWYATIVSEFGEPRLSDRPPGANRNVALAKRMRILFAHAGLPYKHPHAFRHGHAVFGLKNSCTMADYKAVSLNLMHSDIRVTDGMYARLVDDEVKTRIAGLTGSGGLSRDEAALLRKLLRMLERESQEGRAP